MPEYLPQNESPVNQAAKKALRQVNQKLVIQDLHILQLMEWGLDKKKVALRAPRLVGQEQETQFQVLRFNPDLDGLARLFETLPSDPEEPSELLKLAQKKGPLSAVSLAQEGWEQLADWMDVNLMWEDSPRLGDSGM